MNRSFELIALNLEILGGKTGIKGNPYVFTLLEFD